MNSVWQAAATFVPLGRPLGGNSRPADYVHRVYICMCVRTRVARVCATRQRTIARVYAWRGGEFAAKNGAAREG